MGTANGKKVSHFFETRAGQGFKGIREKGGENEYTIEQQDIGGIV